MTNAIINEQNELVITPSKSSSASDFDFLSGCNNVHHKKLKTRLENNNDWIESEGTYKFEKLLNGMGNLERHFMNDNDGGQIEGIALRLFNPSSKLWTIHWTDSKSGILDVPVTGSFENNIGHFYANDIFNDKPILLHFLWDASNSELPVWSQAFSIDNGKNWEWNWYMYFTKGDADNAKQLNIDRKIKVIELRNYHVKSNQRDTFVNYFEENFIDSQNVLLGYTLGQYRVKDCEDNFFWIRGFTNMTSRHKFLNDFYHGAFWKNHRTLPNSLLLNNDNVHLLKPLHININGKDNEGFNANWFGQQKGIAVIDYYISNEKLPGLIEFIKDKYLTLLQSTGINDISFWISELTTNEFKALPVFQDKNLLVSIGFYKNELEYNEKAKSVEQKMNEDERTQWYDLITLRNTLILYPTEKSFTNCHK